MDFAHNFRGNRFLDVWSSFSRQSLVTWSKYGENMIKWCKNDFRHPKGTSQWSLVFKNWSTWLCSSIQTCQISASKWQVALLEKAFSLEPSSTKVPTSRIVAVSYERSLQPGMSVRFVGQKKSPALHVDPGSGERYLEDWLSQVLGWLVHHWVGRVHGAWQHGKHLEHCCCPPVWAPWTPASDGQESGAHLRSLTTSLPPRSTKFCCPSCSDWYSQFPLSSLVLNKFNSEPSECNSPPSASWP